MRFLEALEAARALPDDFVIVTRPCSVRLLVDDLGEIHGIIAALYLGDFIDAADWTAEPAEGAELIEAIVRREGLALYSADDHAIDWNDPADRGRLAAALPVDRYNRAQAQANLRATVASVEGIKIRPVASRFGRLFALEDRGAAFNTLALAKTEAARIARKAA